MGENLALTLPLRAVCDTNVVVSALVFGGRLSWLRGGWASGRLVPVVCRETTEELLRVLAYPKFRLSPSVRTDLLQDLLPFAEIHALPAPAAPDTAGPLLAELRDSSDVVFLRLALAAGVPLVSDDGDITSLRPGALPVRILRLTELRDGLGLA